MSGVLIVFAKRPEPGQVKTRLCPPFTLEQAAAFYACMLEDVLETSARAADALGLEAVLAVHPPEAATTLPAPAGVRREPQQGADLGARMEHAFARELESGRGPVLLRGSDSPTLGLEALGAALDALAHADLVLRPDRDGGYNLVGLGRPAAGLFTHPMSTGSVLAETLAHARVRGLSHALLPMGFDIDGVADFALLAAARRGGLAKDCPRTLAWLDRHGWPSPSADG